MTNRAFLSRFAPPFATACFVAACFVAACFVAACLALGLVAAGCEGLRQKPVSRDGGGSGGGGGSSNTADGGGDRGPCVPGTTCTPANACHVGETACSATGVASCTDTQRLREPGATCGNGSVCNAGACVACASGTACPVAGKPCRAGTVSCTTGAAVCDESGNQLDGKDCGSGMVCQAGTCKACTNGDPCTPTINPCHTGTLACGSGAPVCNDSGAAMANGQPCGENSFCNGGACGACTPGMTCTGNPTACKNGMVNCTMTGRPVCVDGTSKSVGDPCGSNMVCSSTLACVACTAGMTCTQTANRCKTGAFVCTSGAPVCTPTAMNAPDGTNCDPSGGTTMFCLAGACGACTQGMTCTPANACKAGTIMCGTGTATCTEGANKANGTPCGNPQSCTVTGGQAVRTSARSCTTGACGVATTTNCTAPNACNAAGTDCLTCGAGLAACGTGCCAAGQACCGNACVALNTNTNCGACGTTCTAGQQTCSGTPATCKRLDGQSCTTGTQCLSGTCKPFYRDQDGDQQGNPADSVGVCGTAAAAPSGYVANNTDCCDINSLVKKWQLVALDPPSEFRTSPATGCTRPFDYDCNGTVEMQYTALADCYGGGTCPSNPGTTAWWNAVPACGQSDLSGGVCNGDCCMDSSCILHPTPTPLIQGCR